MNTQSLDDVKLDPKVKGSINYVKARAVIDTFKGRAEKRPAKQAVIEYLHGSINSHKIGEQKYVTFPDGSKAKY